MGIYRIKGEGVVKDFYYDSGRCDGIIINEKVFANDNLEHEGYYLKISVDFYNRKYLFSIHFGYEKCCTELSIILQ